MRTAVQHQFSMNPSGEIPRSVFNRTRGYKTTFNEGQLIPFFVDEMVPGDQFTGSLSVFARLATPIVPIMDNIYLNIYFFAVPCRLVWEHWKNFMGEKVNPGDTTTYTVPQATWAGAPINANSLADYFGIPTSGINGSVNALPFRAYNLIWNEWFRDQNLQDSLDVPTDDGPDVISNFYGSPRFVNKIHDYFTSCLPFPQKGTAATIPLSLTAPVQRVGSGPAWTLLNEGTNTHSIDATLFSGNGIGKLGNGVTGLSMDPNGGLQTDLSSAGGTINSLRQAFQIQKMYERDARGGTRYTEVILSHFGVRSPDARQQRPEYLGGGRFPINISPIAQTQGTGASGTTTPQGNLAGIGTVGFSQQAGFTYAASEHCYIFGLMAAKADLNYQQGLEKMWSRSTRFDFYWPSFAHLGEQAVLNGEIYYQDTSDDTGVFGYQERYAEYRYKPSAITGQFRSTYSTPLDMWHLAQKFTSLPVLNDSFIKEQAPMSRIKAITSAPDFLFDSVLNLKCARPMPVYSIPGLVDHF